MTTASEVLSFKAQSNENERLSQLLIQYQELVDIAPPILDVGAGEGDISFAAFQDKEVFLLDNQPYSRTNASDLHRTVTTDFLKTNASEFPQIKTICFFHSLQYIDNDPEVLNEKIRQFAPEHILVAVNRNDHVMRDLVDFYRTQVPNANPEYFSSDFFPSNYKIIQRISFEGIFRGTSEDELIDGISYLMDCQLPSNQRPLVSEILAQYNINLELAIGQELIILRNHS